MSKKTRTIVCLTDEMEKQVYKYCDKYGIKDKNIANCKINGYTGVDIYCSKKKFDQILFKLGGLCKVYI